MDTKIKKAEKLLKEYKKDSYSFGIGCLDDAGRYAAQFGENTLLIISSGSWAEPLREKISSTLKQNSIKCIQTLDTPSPNTPIDEVMEMAMAVKDAEPDCILCVGGGSAIDCAKAANIAAVLETEDLEPFLGVDKVRPALDKEAKELYPLVAVQTNAASGSHLSKNAVITYTDIGQKKLISDPCIVPHRAVFDYSVTKSQGRNLTIDGALDGFSHSLEIYYGSKDDNLAQDICLTSISMIVKWLPLLAKELGNVEYRKVMGLATDLGGYALMLGNTNGAHLNSFSMVDLATHGRACAILNPYYTVFFAPAIVRKLEKLAEIFSKYMEYRKGMDARKLGEAVAGAMLSFYESIGFPATLAQLEGFSDETIKKALEAAKNPQLKVKLKSMPVPLNAETIDEYMGPVLKAAKTGNLKTVKNLPA
ncbi:MAG: iron-containing alcohol dehydrogenase [Actinomycetota bacterium]